MHQFLVHLVKVNIQVYHAVPLLINPDGCVKTNGHVKERPFVLRTLEIELVHR